MALRPIVRSLPVYLLASGFLLATCPSGVPAEEHWPQWRGPHGNGVSLSSNLPTQWGPDENVVWKTPLPSWSGATPVIWEDRIFVTSPSPPEPAGSDEADQAAPGAQRQPAQRPGAGRRGAGRPGAGRGRFGGAGYGGARDPGGDRLLLLCLSKSDGRILWEHQLDRGNRLWRKQNSSSPSPVTDGQRVWAATGTGAVVALTMDGTELWRRDLEDAYGDFGLNWGYASSPLLYQGNLIIEVLHGQRTDDPSYLVCLSGATGDEIWRVERPTDAVNESPDAYTTPALWRTPEGTDQIVVSGGDYVTAHDPRTGEELWRVGGLNPQKSGNYRIIASPVVAGNMIYAPSRRKPLLALRGDASSDPPSAQLAWQWTDDAGPDVPTPVSDGRYFYMVDDQGVATCLEAESGEVVWGPRRAATGTISASPLLADGKLYITNESAVTTILAAGPEFRRLATNELDGTYTLSSIAVSGNQLFLRTSTHLYCIGQPSAGEGK